MTAMIAILIPVTHVKTAVTAKFKTVMTHDGYSSFDKSHVRNDARMYLIIHAQRDHSILFYVQMMDIINS